MTIRHLEVFREVCREGSFTKAAENLNMAQPAVSRVIGELESYYGTRLFERMNRKIYITQAGAALYQYSDSILSQYYETKDVLREIDRVTKIRIGSNISCAQIMISELFDTFRRSYPEVPVTLKVSNSQEIEESLMLNELDFGFIDVPQKSEVFFSTKIAEDPLAIVCAADYEIEQKILFEQLKTEPLLVRERGSGSRRIVEQYFLQEGASPNIVMESSNLYSLVQLCKAKFGILMITKSMLEPWRYDPDLRILEVEGMAMKRSYCFVYHRKKYLTKSMRIFKKLVLENNL